MKHENSELMHSDWVGSARCTDQRRVPRRYAFADGMSAVEKGSRPAWAGGQRSALTLPTTLIVAAFGCYTSVLMENGRTVARWPSQPPSSSFPLR